jgi:hypothetical protein
VAAAALVLRTFDERATVVLQTENAPPPVIEPPVTAIASPNRPVDPVRSQNSRRTLRRTIVEPTSNNLRTTVDFERALPPVQAPADVEIAALSAGDLPAEPALLLAPLEIPSLALTAESFPERE